MTQLETMENWLRSFPGWQGQIFIDHLQPEDGCVGLYPTGLQELERREDVLGNVTAHCRCGFLLRRLVGRQEDMGQAARWLLQLQQWIGSQSAQGLAPGLGDDPAREKIHARQGKLKDARMEGAAVYEVIITAEFIKQY